MRVWAALALLLLSLALQGQSASCDVTLYGDGWAAVECRVPSTGVMEVSLPLLGEPDLMLVTDGSGNPLNYSLDGDVLSVEAADVDEVLIYYQTPDLTNKSGELWRASANVPPNWTVRLTLPQDAVILGVDPDPVDLSWNDSTPILSFAGGFSVEYTIPPAAGGGGGGGEAGWDLLPPAVALAVGAAAAGGAYVSLRRRRRVPEERPRLSLDDIAVLRYLLDAGGRAYQSEIRESLRIPKTTLWRRLKRLEAAGLVHVDRRPEGHLVALTERGRGLAGERRG